MPMGAIADMTVITLTNAAIDSGLDSGYHLAPAQFTFSIPVPAVSTWETSAGNYTGTN